MRDMLKAGRQLNDDNDLPIPRAFYYLSQQVRRRSSQRTREGRPYGTSCIIFAHKRRTTLCLSLGWAHTDPRPSSPCDHERVGSVCGFYGFVCMQGSGEGSQLCAVLWAAGCGRVCAADWQSMSQLAASAGSAHTSHSSSAQGTAPTAQCVGLMPSKHCVQSTGFAEEATAHCPSKQKHGPGLRAADSS